MRNQKCFIVDFSPAMHEEISLLHQFLKKYFYTNTSVAHMDMKSQRIVEELFSIFTNDWMLLPMDVRKHLDKNASDERIADVVCEYIANMTDMHAIEEHKKLYDPHTRF